MTFYSSPPPLRQFSDAKPTLLVSWWITAFCTVLILLRLAGRYIRVERLFFEDKLCALALVPLYIRIACVHIVLLYGTNNVDLAGVDLSQAKINRHITGSQLVLASRIFYAATYVQHIPANKTYRELIINRLWALKFTTLEFLNRLAGASMKKVYLRQITFLRYALFASFLAVIISDLAECRPVSHYWQVTPDPGAQCRQGFAQLLTTGASSAIIDIILIAFPVPIVLSTRIPTKRKVLLVLLFFFGFITVGVTVYRIPKVIQHHGDQVYRSMWASIELFAATTVANLVALGSFLRDSGVKKTKFRQEEGSSGVTSSNKQGPQASKTWSVVEDKKWAPTDSGAWRETKDLESNSHSSDARGHSPSDSNDSLIHLEREASSGFMGRTELSYPKSPRAAVTAGMRGYQRR